MLRNVTINTSVGPLVGVAADNGVVYINGTPHALTMYAYDKQTPLCVIPTSGTIVRVPGEPIRDRNGVQIGSVGISHYA